MSSSPTFLTSGVSGEGVSSVVMNSFTLPANRLGMIFVITAGGGPPLNVPTISGWTVPPNGSVPVSDARRATVLHRVSGSDVTEGPTIDCAGQAQSFIQYFALHWDANAVITGTNGANGIVQCLGSGNVHSPSVNATPTLDALAAFAHANNPTISAINIGFQSDVGDVGGGFTELARRDFGGGQNKGTIVQYKTTNDTVHELTGCTNSADMFIGMAVEVAHIPTVPTITDQPDDATVADGATAGFTVAATGTGTLTYQWQRLPPLGGSWANVSGGSGGTSASYTTPTLDRDADTGALYRCVVTDDNGSTNSNSAELTVTGATDTGGMVVGSTGSWVGESFVAASDASDGPIASLALTEAGDFLSAAATLVVEAALSQAETGDALSASAAVAVVADQALTETGDSLLAEVDALEDREADLNLAETGDALSASTAVDVGATLSLTEAGDSLSASATLDVVASVALTESGDALAASGSVALEASLSLTEDVDALSAAASVAAVADLSLAEIGDSLSAAATVGLAAVLTLTEGGDSLTATASLAVEATLGLTEAGDALAASATVESDDVQAELLLTEAGDSLSGVATVGVAMQLVLTEAEGGLTAAASTDVGASLALTEGADSLVAAASVGIDASLSIEELQDALSAAAAHVVFAELDLIEAGDMLLATGLTVLADLSDFYRYDVPAPSMRYDVPASAIGYDVPGLSLRYDIPSMPN